MEMTLLAELLLALTPALVLVAALLHGRYPGERALARIAHGLDYARPRTPASILPFARAPRALLRSGELIARSLATRPPPVPLRA